MKRFKTKRRTKNRLLKNIMYLIIIIFSVIYSLKILYKFVKINDEEDYNRLLFLSSNNIIGDISVLDLVNFNLSSPENLFKMSNIDIGELVIENKPIIKEEKEPIIYIYNTHQSEEYSSKSLEYYNIKPTVYMASNILKKKLHNLGIESIVEEQPIKDVLIKNNWNYNESYKASRLWLDNIKKNNPNIKYFIDLHRDSATFNTKINDISYAKMMFVVGMNHDSYKENERLMIDLNNYLNNKYNGVMRDIFYGKNSKYNQDFNYNTILIEIGGPDSNIEEIYNSVSIFAEALANVIGG